MRLLPAIFLAIFTCLPAGLHAERADARGFDGIYTGTIGMQLDTRKSREFQAPAKLVVLPDGRSALLTAQHPQGVLCVVMKGEVRKNTFIAASRGRLDFGGYHHAMNWDVTFDAKKGTAVIHGKAVNLPAWAKPDDDRYTFRKQAKP